MVNICEDIKKKSQKVYWAGLGTRIRVDNSPISNLSVRALRFQKLFSLYLSVSFSPGYACDMYEFGFLLIVVVFLRWNPIENPLSLIPQRAIVYTCNYANIPTTVRVLPLSGHSLRNQKIVGD